MCQHIAVHQYNLKLAYSWTKKKFENTKINFAVKSYIQAKKKERKKKVQERKIISCSTMLATIYWEEQFFLPGK